MGEVVESDHFLTMFDGGFFKLSIRPQRQLVITRALLIDKAEGGRGNELEIAGVRREFGVQARRGKDTSDQGSMRRRRCRSVLRRRVAHARGVLVSMAMRAATAADTVHTGPRGAGVMRASLPTAAVRMVLGRCRRRAEAMGATTKAATLGGGGTGRRERGEEAERGSEEDGEKGAKAAGARGHALLSAATRH